MKTIEFNFDNVGGLARLILIAAAGVKAIHTNVTTGRVVPVIRTGTTIYNLGVYGDGSFLFKETKSQSEGGASWDVSISGFIPRLDNLTDISVLEQGEWIALHQDANGNIIISGTREIPLSFMSEKSSGGPSSKNATAFTLQAQEPAPSMMAESSAMEIS